MSPLLREYSYNQLSFISVVSSCGCWKAWIRGDDRNLPWQYIHKDAISGVQGFLWRALLPRSKVLHLLELLTISWFVCYPISSMFSKSADVDMSWARDLQVCHLPSCSLASSALIFTSHYLHKNHYIWITACIKHLSSLIHLNCTGSEFDAIQVFQGPGVYKF